MRQRSILLLATVLSALASVTPSASQPAPQGDTVRWYDTLTITKPRYARMTDGERFVLSLYAAATIPSLIVVGGFAAVPPSLSVMQEEGVWRTGVGVTTGIGFGGDRSKRWWFYDARLQGEVVWYFDREHPLLVRALGLVDYRVAPLGQNRFYWFGVAGGGGISTDFATLSPFAEGWIGVMNPNGVRFVGMFPMHNFGLRSRVGYNLTHQRHWIELSLGGTSTF
ncbi:MAG: hypothetical protein JNJ94_16175 [Chlorobi bacterium]|nr:hypothetical protein [Chlorobiota bacterium]